MTDTQTGTQSDKQSDTLELDPTDPRYGLAAAVTAAQATIRAATESGTDLLGKPTPCPEFSVEDLVEHMIYIARRVALIGNGGHFSEASAEPAGSDWSGAFAREAQAMHEAWADPAKLGGSYQVPWGEAPGAALMLAYTGEFATHTWDLARAAGLPLDIDDEALGGAAEAVRFIPADGRDDPAIPFGPVVEAPADATNLERIVTWVGRSLDWSPTER